MKDNKTKFVRRLIQSSVWLNLVSDYVNLKKEDHYDGQMRLNYRTDVTDNGIEKRRACLDGDNHEYLKFIGSGIIISFHLKNGDLNTPEKFYLREWHTGCDFLAALYKAHREHTKTLDAIIKLEQPENHELLISFTHELCDLIDDSYNHWSMELKESFDRAYKNCKATGL